MRACGFDDPSPAGKWIAALSPHAVCPKCSFVATAPPARVESLQKGEKGACPKCGTTITLEHLKIPKYPRS